MRGNPSSGTAQRRRIREGYLTVEQIEAVLAACERLQDRLLLRLIYAYGLRATEAATLSVRDLDLDRGLIEINRQKGSESGPKPLLPELRKEIDAWLEERSQKSEWLFPAPGNLSKPYTRWNVYRIFRAAAARAELPRRLQHPHVLKHSIATNMLDSGASIRATQKWIGLKSMQTMSHYAEVTGKMEADALDTARGLLRGGKKK